MQMKLGAGRIDVRIDLALPQQDIATIALPGVPCSRSRKLDFRWLSILELYSRD